MARKKQPAAPLPRLIADTALEDLAPASGSDALELNASLWLAALDRLIPATPTDLLELFRIIGPDGPDKATSERARISEENKRVAALLRNKAGGLGVNVRTVQRYRRGAAGLGGETRGQTQRRLIPLLNELRPHARALILSRYMALAEAHGLAGYFTGWTKISKTPRHIARGGGVPGAEYLLGPTMTETADRFYAGDYVGAAFAYFSAWLYDWGWEGDDEQAKRWFNIVDDKNNESGITLSEPESWELSLGYPSPWEHPDGAAGWWADTDLDSVS